LPWDRPITEWIADHRTAWLDDFWTSVTHLGDDVVAWVVVACCVAQAWPRCRPLAVANQHLSLARPIILIVLKELIDRDRPLAELAISQPGGPSFPSGHPFAAAASLGFVPLVVALYTRRRWIWWVSVGVAWSLIVLVAASRVYLGAHFTTDVIATLLLAVVFIAAAELLIEWLHERNGNVAVRCRPPNQSRSNWSGATTSSELVLATPTQFEVARLLVTTDPVKRRLRGLGQQVRAQTPTVGGPIKALQIPSWKHAPNASGADGGDRTRRSRASASPRRAVLARRSSERLRASGAR
jgi:undecaprenyl-diphosphatase